jgi:hypothetical protein
MSSLKEHQRTTDREHVAELIHHWREDVNGIVLTERQRHVMTHLKDDASDRFARDTSAVVQLCDCAEANIWHYGKLAKHNHGPNPGKDASFSSVPTIAKPDGTCKFCGYYTQTARSSQLDSTGRLKNGAKAASKPKAAARPTMEIGSKYGHWTVVKAWDKLNGNRPTKMIEALCQCGTRKEMRQATFGKAKSCGCKAYEHHAQLVAGAIARKKRGVE